MHIVKQLFAVKGVLHSKYWIKSIYTPKKTTESKMYRPSSGLVRDRKNLHGPTNVTAKVLQPIQLIESHLSFLYTFKTNFV